jgi:hypothetical protein
MWLHYGCKYTYFQLKLLLHAKYRMTKHKYIGTAVALLCFMNVKKGALFLRT